jgi:hypothetical protein
MVILTTIVRTNELMIPITVRVRKDEEGIRESGRGYSRICEAWNRSLRRSPIKRSGERGCRLGEVCLERICTVGCLRHPSFTVRRPTVLKSGHFQGSRLAIYKTVSLRTSDFAPSTMGQEPPYPQRSCAKAWTTKPSSEKNSIHPSRQIEGRTRVMDEEIRAHTIDMFE